MNHISKYNVNVVVAQPAFTITQNANGTLTINGTATANLEVTIAFQTVPLQ